MRRVIDSRRNDQGGFTMIEALVALVVVGVGMLTLLQLAPRATHSGTQGRRISEAMSLAQDKVEELKAMPVESADLASGTHIDGADLGAFTRRWEVTTDSPISGMRKVEVRVSYETLSADSVAVLTTYF
jgi:prepilin-type N-terminal cleavage/methylation domain-containing protein